AGLWVGLAGAAALLGLGLVAFFTLFKRPPVAAPSTGPSGAGLVAQADPSAPPGGSRDSSLPRERLLADNERFTALLAQVHGHGGKETPELRSLLNDQAALASKALAGKCTDGSLTCKAWAEVRDLMVGDQKRAIVKRRRGSDTESTRTRWMAGLKMPAIHVEDDPRVLRVFEFYTQNPVGRETFQSMLFRCGAYRDLIQATLIRYDMPPDLMALAFTESGCEPSAKSPVGAAGLWQFMPETARAYHLRVIEGTIDERYSPFKSTEASIRMLADLRQKLGDWDLVFASYNLGPFGVLARVERAGGNATFWDLVDADLLPDETANYSPTVEAIALILANLQRLKFTGLQIHSPQLTADLEVPGGTRLGLVARAAATSVAKLSSLNLDFSGDVVPLIPGGAIAVQVNKDVVWQARDSIKELLASKDGADQCVPPSFDWGKQRFTPEMDAACQRRLAAGAGAANPAAP
ncbi:MAG TPA: transglycosylase SLT domain-containing protein, partial [Polyangiaceae bacterium]